MYEEWGETKSIKSWKNLGIAMTMFMIGVVAIIIQMLLTVDICFVLGETISVLVGRNLYAAMMVYNGIWRRMSAKVMRPIWKVPLRRRYVQKFFLPSMVYVC